MNSIRKHIVALVMFGTLPMTLPGQEAADEEIKRDPETGMIMAENWELVRANCIICHSPQQFLRQRGTRSTWQSVIDWMQKDHGLIWLVDPELEDKIVTYLAENYAPRKVPIGAPPFPQPCSRQIPTSVS